MFLTPNWQLAFLVFLSKYVKMIYLQWGLKWKILKELTSNSDIFVSLFNFVIGKKFRFTGKKIYWVQRKFDSTVKKFWSTLEIKTKLKKKWRFPGKKFLRIRKKIDSLESDFSQVRNSNPLQRFWLTGKKFRSREK